MAKILKNEDYKKKINLKERLGTESPTSFASTMSLGGVIGRDVLDAKAEAMQIIEEAQAEARRIKQEAQELLLEVQTEMEQSKRKASEEGYQDGLAHGLELLYRVKELRATLFQDNEKEMVKLVFEIAKKIIGREFSENDKAIMNVLRLAISDAVGERIVVRLNPKDWEKVQKKQTELLAKLPDVNTVTFREDETVNPGGCFVETEIGTIDAQLETQLAAIKKALGL